MNTITGPTERVRIEAPYCTGVQDELGRDYPANAQHEVDIPIGTAQKLKATRTVVPIQRIFSGIDKLPTAAEWAALQAKEAVHG